MTLAPGWRIVSSGRYRMQCGKCIAWVEPSDPRGIYRAPIGTAIGAIVKPRCVACIPRLFQPSDKG